MYKDLIIPDPVPAIGHEYCGVLPLKTSQSSEEITNYYPVINVKLKAFVRSKVDVKKARGLSRHGLQAIY